MIWFNLGVCCVRPCVLAGRSAWSRCWCTAEAVLTTIIFVYAMIGAVEIVRDQDVARGCFLFPPVVICIGCAVWTGASHSLWTSRVRRAVGTIVSVNASEIGRLGPGSWADSLSLDRVDVFEYHDVITLSLYVLKVVSVWLLLQTLSLGVTLCVVIYLLLAFSIQRDALWVLGIFVALWVGCFCRLLCTCGVAGRIWKLGEACRTRSFYARVRPVLLVANLLHAVLLYLSPVPAVLYWCLISMHTARAVKVLASLHARSDGRADTSTVVAGDLV